MRASYIWLRGECCVGGNDMNASCKQPKKRLAYVGDDSLDEKSPCKTKGFGVQCNCATMHCIACNRCERRGPAFSFLSWGPCHADAMPCRAVPSVSGNVLQCPVRVWHGMACSSPAAQPGRGPSCQPLAARGAIVLDWLRPSV